MTSDEGLDRWIRNLRRSLARGELAGLPPFDVGDGTLCLTGETTARSMLADLDDLDDPAGSWGGDGA